MQGQSFYEKQYQENQYAPGLNAEEHVFFPTLMSFIDQFQLHNKRCLEVGSGRGAFQDVVEAYYSLDISYSAGMHHHKPFAQASATEIPFPDNTFDFVWSYAALEHIPNPEKVLSELRRVIKPNGFLLLAPAWQCRSWAAEGYPVRPYKDFNLIGKLIKLSIPIRDSIIYRAPGIFTMRILRLLSYFMNPQPLEFRYKQLQPNFEKFWMSDSDAVNSMDPFDAIMWYGSRGDECLNYPTRMNQLFVRTGALLFRIHKHIELSEL